MNNSIYRDNGNGKKSPSSENKDDDRYIYHDKQVSGLIDRVMSHPRSNPIVDPRMFQSIQESSSMKTNPNSNQNTNRDIYMNTQNDISSQKRKVQNFQQDTQNNRFVNPPEQTVEDRIALDLANQKRRLQNTSTIDNVKPLNSSGKHASIEESCVNGVCTTLQRNLEVNNIRRDAKPSVPPQLIPCLTNGKYHSNLAVLYSTEDHYNIACDGMCGKTSITDGYHYGKTDLCVPCFKTYNSLLKINEYKDPNPRNQLGGVFDNFGSIYGSGGYNNVQGSPY